MSKIYIQIYRILKMNGSPKFNERYIGFGVVDMGRRSQLEICLDILKAVAEGRRKPTHIMYRANLSWVRLKKYINFLIARGLLREIINDNNQNSPHFSLTRKGKEVVKYYMEIKMIMQDRVGTGRGLLSIRRGGVLMQ